MAIYYIDPHTTTNGTGTWASPFSFSSAIRTGVVAGDEIRIKSIPLTSLLTATVYTATYTNPCQLTLTAGGSLGTDWALYDIAYLPYFDTFFKVVYKSGNIIGLSSFLISVVLPVHNSTTTSLTVRKVNITTYTPSQNTGNLIYGVSITDTSNITISDGWIDETTRVTDGTAKTIINSSSTTSSNITVHWDSGSYNAGVFASGRNSDCPNTHIFNGNTTNGYITFNLIYNGTSTFNQIFSAQNNGYCVYGQVGLYIQNLNVTFKSLTNQRAIGTSYGKDIFITVDNSAFINSGDAIGNSQNLFLQNVSLSIGNIFANSTGNFLVLNSGISVNLSITINGMIDLYAAGNNNGFVGSLGDYSVSFGSSFSIMRSKRTATITSTVQKYNSNGAFFNGSIVYFPTVATPSGWTIDNYASLNNSGISTNLLQTNYPTQAVLVFPVSLGSIQLPNGNTSYGNALYTFKDGTAPFEQLGFKQSAYSQGQPSPANTATVTTDAGTFRTTGPSLKANVATINTLFWNDPSRTIATKTIKVPVIAGVSCTITGYIRTNISTYVDNDCKVRVMFNNTQLATQNMTATAILNAWGSFSLTFTPTYTGEAIFCWDLFYRTAGNFWLDDLAIA